MSLKLDIAPLKIEIPIFNFECATKNKANCHINIRFKKHIFNLYMTYHYVNIQFDHEFRS